MQKKILKKNWSHITLLWKKRKKKTRGNRRKHVYIYIFINYIRNTVVASTVAEFRKAAFYARPNVPSVVVAFGSLG